MADSTKRRERKSKKDNPLWLHQSGQWCKKIKGRFVYFGTDLEKALALYAQEHPSWEAGIDPRDGRAVSGSPTIAEICNAYLDSQDEKVQAGELSPRTFREQKGACEALVSHFGRNRRVVDVRPAHFKPLRAKLAKRYGPTRLTNEVIRTRSVFKFAYENELIEKPVRYGTEFAPPPKKQVRRQRNERKLEALSAADVKSLIDNAKQPLRTFLLLGINCGFGATDIATLPIRAVDLDDGWINYARPKTEVPRRSPLWPETVVALREVMANRPDPLDPGDEPLAFLTCFGRRWYRLNAADAPTDAIGQEFTKLLVEKGLKRPGIGFYHLRHLFQTVGERSRDTPAVTSLMGHVDASMADHYRLSVEDERLQSVTDHVHRWLFGEADVKLAETPELRVVG